MNEHTFLRLQDEVYKLQETVRELENKCFELFEKQNKFNSFIAVVVKDITRISTSLFLKNNTL